MAGLVRESENQRLITSGAAQAKLDAGGELRLIGKALKVTVVVDPSVLAGWVVPAANPQTAVTIEAGGRVVRGAPQQQDIAADDSGDRRAWGRPGFGDRAGTSPGR